MDLKPGDIFLSAVPGIIGTGINAVQRVWDKAGHSQYSHAGLIVDSDGTTIESQGRVVHWNLFKRYAGVPVLIARHDCMNSKSFEKGYMAITNQIGKSYPIYRILFHLFPPIAKMNDGRLVCSELVSRFLYEIELTGFYNSATPDDLHNMICWHHGWSIVYSGVLSDSLATDPIADPLRTKHIP